MHQQHSLYFALWWRLVQYMSYSQTRIFSP